MRLFSFAFFILFLFVLSHVRTMGQADFILGADLSYANMMEDCGAVFRENGSAKDVYQIFADNGTNLVRIRVWHNPDWQESLVQPAGVKPQYNNFEDAKEAISRAKKAGMKVMLDIHFSDFWCDPGKQVVPKAWAGIASNATILKDSVYNYVAKMLTILNNESLMPEYVKVGNENNAGLMVHSTLTSTYTASGVISNSWSRHAQLYNAAIKAVREVSEKTTIKPKIALHVADHSKADWFYGNIIANGVSDFDIMGFTYYYSYHGGSINAVGNVISTLKTKFPKYDAMIVETGYLWDNENIDGLGNIINSADPNYLPVGPSNQRKYLSDLSKAVQNAGGLGIIFWEPAWVSTPCRTAWGQGSSQEHVAFFDHRNNLNFMKNGGGGWPDMFKNNLVFQPVNVVFKVDMTGADLSNGVFITGSFTSTGNWSIVPMKAEGNNIFSHTVQLMPGDKGAYYFMNKNAWGSREKVPAECATWWNSDRGYVVPDHDTLIGHRWGSCEQLPTSSELFEYENISIAVYPNPLKQQPLTIKLETGEMPNAELEIISASGKRVFGLKNIKKETRIEPSLLKPGIYLIKIQNLDGSLIEKLLVL